MTIIEFDEGRLDIKFEHNFDLAKQESILRAEGLQPGPRLGEPRKATTSFNVTLEKPLYIGLQEVHVEDPNSLLTLVTDLRNYQEEQSTDLTITQHRLIDYTIDKLKQLLVTGEV
jgi:hypothetical protein